MAKSYIKNKGNTRKIAIIAVIVVVILLFGFWVYRTGETAGILSGLPSNYKGANVVYVTTTQQTTSVYSTIPTTTIKSCPSINVGTYGNSSTGGNCINFTVNIGSHGTYRNYQSACPSTVNIGTYGIYYNNVTGCNPQVNVGTGSIYYNINNPLTTSSTVQSTIPTTSIYYSTAPTTTVEQINTACYASAGYYCLNPVLTASTGNLTVGMGQNTGQNWTGVDIVFVPQGTAYNSGLPAVSFNYPHAAYLLSLKSGYYVNVTLPVTSKISSGTIINGSIWAKFSQSVFGKPQYTEMATGEFMSS